jgi:hypothetical protein
LLKNFNEQFFHELASVKWYRMLENGERPVSLLLSGLVAVDLFLLNGVPVPDMLADWLLDSSILKTSILTWVCVLWGC